MKISSVLTFSFFTALLCGCSTTGQKPVDKINKSWVANRVTYYNALAQGNKPTDADPLSTTIETGPERNVMIEDIMRLIDLDYENFTTGIRRSKSYTDLGLDLVSIGIGTYGTLTGSSETKTVLSALNTALAGGRASFDKNVLLEQTIPVLIAKMGAQRAKQKLYIRKRMFVGASDGTLSTEATAIGAYSVTEALTDLTEYYYAGTLTRALAAVAEDAAAEKKKAEAALKVLSVSYGEDDATATLMEFVYPGGKLNAENQATLRGWIQKNVDPPVGIPTFLHGGSRFATARALAAAEIVQ